MLSAVTVLIRSAGCCAELQVMRVFVSPSEGEKRHLESTRATQHFTLHQDGVSQRIEESVQEVGVTKKELMPQCSS